MGLRGMPEVELAFENLAIAEDMVLAPPSGFRRGFAELMNAYNSQRVGAGTVALGIAAGAFELAVEWRSVAASSAALSPSSRAFSGCWRTWQPASPRARCSCTRRPVARPEWQRFPDQMAAARAKLFASETAIKVMNDALQMCGARGYSRDMPLERMVRDVRMFTIGGGTAQILRTVVASGVLGMKLPQTRDGYLRTIDREKAAE